MCDTNGVQISQTVPFDHVGFEAEKILWEGIQEIKSVAEGNNSGA